MLTDNDVHILMTNIKKGEVPHVWRMCNGFFSGVFAIGFYQKNVGLTAYARYSDGTHIRCPEDDK